MEDDDAASVSGISSILSAHTPERGGVDPTASGRAIEAALEEAEQLMRLGSATHTGIRSAGKKSLSSIIDASEQLRQQVWHGGRCASSMGGGWVGRVSIGRHLPTFQYSSLRRPPPPRCGI